VTPVERMSQDEQTTERCLQRWEGRRYSLQVAHATAVERMAILRASQKVVVAGESG
jgi:hypothetical protein